MISKTKQSILKSELIAIENHDFNEYYDQFDTDRNLRYIILTCIKMELGNMWELKLQNEVFVLLYQTNYFEAIAGQIPANHALLSKLYEKLRKHKMILIPDDSWQISLKEYFGFKFIQKRNARIKLDGKELDVAFLSTLKQNYSAKYDYEGFTIRKIQSIDVSNLSEKLFEEFSIFFDRESFGNFNLAHVAVDKNGQVVSISAAGHPPVNNHYEIQIITDPKYRRKGLSMMVTITHLIESLEQGYEPHWDAATELSAKIAEKLGYTNPLSYDLLAYTTPVIQILRLSRIPKLIIWILRKFGKLQD